MVSNIRQIGRKGRKKRGTSLVEAIVAAIIIVPVALFLLDLSVLVLANSINDKAVKNAARAAANQPDGASAWQAANVSLASFRSSPIVKSLTIKSFSFPPSNALETVSCTTKMEVKLPVPFPGFNNITFLARAEEPIVGHKHK